MSFADTNRVIEGDPRYWILDPNGHREQWHTDAVAAAHDNPDMVMPTDETWICDLCNSLILTRFGDQPFPVPVEAGDYALCHDCYRTEKTAPYQDPQSGEEWPFPKGEWPPNLCGCGPCWLQAQRWKPALRTAYYE